MALGNVAAAAPSTVLPFALCASLQEQREWPLVASMDYPDGRYQLRVQATSPTRTWSLVRRLTLAQYQALLAFQAARKGPAEPFYAYLQQAQHDPSGVSATGRLTVRFEGPVQAVYGPSRYEVSFTLREVS